MQILFLYFLIDNDIPELIKVQLLVLEVYNVKNFFRKYVVKSRTQLQLALKKSRKITNIIHIIDFWRFNSSPLANKKKKRNWMRFVTVDEERIH